MRHSSWARLAATLAMVSGAGAAFAQTPAGGDDASPVLALAALALAAIALVASLLALARARRTARDFESLARSMDAAMARIRAETSSRADLLAGAQSELRGQIEALRDVAGGRSPEGAEVISHPSSRREGARAARPEPDAGEIEAALARAVDGDALELSLQPIVSVSSNAARAFETFAHLRLPSGRAIDIGRPAGQPGDFDRAAFEGQLVRRAVEVGRRRLGSQGEFMPLHCPISGALLDDDARAAGVVDLVRLDASMARSIVLSAPSRLLVDASRARRRTLEPFLSAGLAFAAEGWEGDLDTLPALRGSAVGWLKLDADRLLDRDRSRRKSPHGFDVVAAAADCGIAVIAAGVASDEDAVSLLDIGVDLMAGQRFGGPRRLRAPAEAASGGRVG